MSLFKGSDKYTEIFISLGTGCPTGCQSCYKTLIEDSFYSLQDIRNQIDTSHRLSDDTFTYFLYGTNNLKNPELFKIIKYIRSLKRRIRIQIPLPSRGNSLEKILKENFNNEYVISKKIDSKESLKALFDSVTEFLNYQSMVMNYDLLIKKEYINFIERALKIKLKRKSDGTFSARVGNIYMNLRVLYFIDYKEKKVENVGTDSCFSYESFDVMENHIKIHDHYEIDKNLDICFHNPLCYIGANKVANLAHKREKILLCFKEYKNNYLNSLNKDLEHNCFKCISKGFDYNHYVK